MGVRGWWLLAAVGVALVIGASRILLLGVAWLCAMLALDIRRAVA